MKLVTCAICGARRKRIAPRHTKTHGLSMAEYRAQFPDALLWAPALCAQISTKLCGHVVAQNTKRKISKALAGKVISADKNNKLQEGSRRYWAQPEAKAARARAQIRSWQNPTRRIRARRLMQKLWRDPARRARIGAKISASVKATWRKTKRNFQACPNKFECALLALLAPLGFRFTGDGSVWITVDGHNMNPDFISHDKIIVEGLGDYWHDEAETKLRKARLRRAGYRVVVIWHSEFYKNPRVLLRRVARMRKVKVCAS